MSQAEERLKQDDTHHLQHALLTNDISINIGHADQDYKEKGTHIKWNPRI